MGVLSDLKISYSAWRNAGWPLPRAVWETIQQFGQYSQPEQIAMLITAGIGMTGTVLAIGLPIARTLNPLN